MTEQDPLKYFLLPSIPCQRRYEALRAYFLENLTEKEAAERFGYSLYTFQALVSKFKRGEISLFSLKKSGPKSRRTPDEVQERIVTLRKQGMSLQNIHQTLMEEGQKIGIITVGRILKDAGFSKLPRRTRREKGLTEIGTAIPEAPKRLDFQSLSGERFDCQVAGVYLFVPYLLGTGLPDLIKSSSFPETADLTRLNSILSILALKFIGVKRLSQISNYSFDQGLGLFAGLNVLPKSTAISTYSYGIDRHMVEVFQQQFISRMNSIRSDYYASETINLDFHTIPHYGEEPPLDKNWVSSRNRAMKGALTLLAQDGGSRALSYANANIHRSDAPREIIKFIDYWSGIKGVIDQTLVFDSRLTNYGVLREMDDAGVKFITLRRRGKQIIEHALSIPDEDWTRVELTIPKRKYNKFLAYDWLIDLPEHGTVREVIIKEHGRRQPTFIITNNVDMKLPHLVECYAHRWRVENKISELVDFFSLNALSSPIMIRIHFDVLMTMVADTCYRLFAGDLPKFESMTARDLFTKFIDTPGRVIVNGDEVVVKLRKNARTPILMSCEVFRKSYEVPWWDNRTLRFNWGF
jgi:transposase